MVSSALGFASEQTRPFDGQRLAHPSQGKVRPKGPSLDLETKRLARHFNIMVQQLEPRILPYPQPYDASPPKVRERTHSAEFHRHRAMPGGDAVESRAKIHNALFGLLTEEFQGEV